MLAWGTFDQIFVSPFSMLYAHRAFTRRVATQP